MKRLALIGATGRLGSAILKLAEASNDLEICGTPKHGENFADTIRDCDVAIDVSQPDVLAEILRTCVDAKKALVIGTTGHSQQELALIDDAAQSIPVLHSANFSVGVNVLFFLTRTAAKILGQDFAATIFETHHVMKKDSPSGTAKTLAQILQEQGRAHVPIESAREGLVVGDHSVVFSGADERLTLQHSAESREIFARGALLAAGWLSAKSPGHYRMEDVLGLSA